MARTYHMTITRMDKFYRHVPNPCYPCISTMLLALSSLPAFSPWQASDVSDTMEGWQTPDRQPNFA